MSASEHSVKAISFQGFSSSASLGKQVTLREKQFCPSRCCRSSPSTITIIEEDAGVGAEVELNYSFETRRVYSPYFPVSSYFREAFFVPLMHTSPMFPHFLVADR